MNKASADFRIVDHTASSQPLQMAVGAQASSQLCTKIIQKNIEIKKFDLAKALIYTLF